MSNIHIESHKDTCQESTLSYRVATCPECGQKLVEVREVIRKVDLRIKCRRCGTYVSVYAYRE